VDVLACGGEMGWGGRDVPMPPGAPTRSASLPQRALEKEMLHSSKTPWRSWGVGLVDAVVGGARCGGRTMESSSGVHLMGMAAVDGVDAARKVNSE
jgi:hypothetical protein